MSKGNKKEKWEKPKLIVITRGDKQERVLLQCKGNRGAGPISELLLCGGWISRPPHRSMYSVLISHRPEISPCSLGI